MLEDLRITLPAAVATCALRLFYATFRVERLEVPAAVQEVFGGRPAICCFWHNRQLLMPFFYRFVREYIRERRVYTLISSHRDGRIIAKAVRPLGIESVAGSSTRRGYEGLVGLVEVLKRGDHAAITPDGPRGPVYRAKAGAIKMAQLSGAPLIPASWSATAQWRFGSWDGMILPKPFAAISLVMGEPIFVPAELSEGDLEEHRKKLEAALMLVEGRSPF